MAVDNKIIWGALAVVTGGIVIYAMTRPAPTQSEADVITPISLDTASGVVPMSPAGFQNLLQGLLDSVSSITQPQSSTPQASPGIGDFLTALQQYLTNMADSFRSYLMKLPPIISNFKPLPILSGCPCQSGPDYVSGLPSAGALTAAYAANVVAARPAYAATMQQDYLTAMAAPYEAQDATFFFNGSRVANNG